MTFRVGQYVAVHDDRAGYAYGDLFPFTKGQVVTVEQLGPMDCVKVSGDYRFWANERFRPLVERKTSIELFHQIRRDVENNVPAELVGERA